MIDDKKLESHLDTVRKKIKTKVLEISLGEMIIMYENGALFIHPEYQVNLTWKLNQKSKLIESILIGMPLPLFSIAEDYDGTWEAIYDVQTISTIFDFINILENRNKNHDNYERFSNLSSYLLYLKDFANKSWNDFSSRIQLDFKMIKIKMIIFRDMNAVEKLHLFNRLNWAENQCYQIKNECGSILSKIKPLLSQPKVETPYYRKGAS